MNERLLQFIWQYQYYNQSNLCTADEEKLEILFPGQISHHQGPDFSNAKIRIGKTVWVGSVELHLQTSGWKKHKHQDDPNYKNVILHVVWEDDTGERHLPLLELKDRVPKFLLCRYSELMQSAAFIPCVKLIHSINQLVWQAWKDRLLAERLLRKSRTVETLLRQSNYHWEETCWWLLARNFGIPVNADAFEMIARSIPLTLLNRHKKHIHQLEALLMGQAGLLEKEFRDSYSILLQKEYRFLREKYQLQPIHHPIHFLRMRPGNFPSIRLAQLAMLLYTSAPFFTIITEETSVKKISKWLEVKAGEYWDRHYKPGEPGAFRRKKMGDSMIGNIIINTVTPLLFAYGDYHDENKYKNKALQWLEETAAEYNSITLGFSRLGIDNNNAFDSQALIELKNEYCNKRRCLDCAVGNTLLKQG